MDEFSWIVQVGLGVGLAVAMMWNKSLRDELDAQNGRMDRMNDRIELNTEWFRKVVANNLTQTDLRDNDP